MTAPSIKEALKPCPFCGGEPDIRTRMDEDIWTHNIVKWTGVHCAECGIGFEWPPGAEPDAAEQWNTRATFQPDGERREAIARMIEPHSNLFVDPTELASWNEALAKADLILASGLVQDEAGIRADEREKCARIAERFGEPYALNTNTGAMMFRAQVSKIAAAIRSARDGGAET